MKGKNGIKMEEFPEPGRLVTPDKTNLEKDGVILLYRYVKPFMRVVRGYGFRGIQEVRVSDHKALCKICGEWCERVAVHAKLRHEYSHLNYKAAFDLSVSSSLDGETEREQKIRLAKKYSSRPSRRRRTPALVSGRGSTRLYRLTRPKEHRLEVFNKKGTCDLQLVTLIQETAKKLGRSPAPNEVFMDGFQMGPTIKNRLSFSWAGVLAVCDLKPQWKEYGRGFISGSGAALVPVVFADKNRPKGRYYSKADGRIKVVDRRPYWSGETLLLWARLMYQKKRRWPSSSDFRRGNNGPNLKIVRDEFGSLREFTNWAKTNLRYKTIWKQRKAQMEKKP